MGKNAIILAAGKSNSLAPFTYEKPKGLFIVKGELLIERQIKQLIEAGIEDIYVVVGYMKEKFFYLEKKFPEVKLILNNTFRRFGNIYSIYLAREHLSNTYICCADQYYVENPFTEENELNKSYRATTYLEGEFNEYSIDYSDADVITRCSIGGKDSCAMVGHAYFNENFSKKFRQLLEDQINDFGVKEMFWESFYAKNINELTLHIHEFENDEILEFDNVDDLRFFDSNFLINVDSEIIDNICKTFECQPNEILDIEVINAGFTNVSFKFTYNETDYVYRHPGGSDKYYSKRSNEIYAQTQAKKYGIDKSLVYIDPSGWKISYFIHDIVPIDILGNEKHRKQLMDAIHKTHEIPVSDEIEEFNNFEEGMKLISFASITKRDLFDEFGEIFDKISLVNDYVKAEREKYGIELVVSHHDIYEPNLLPTEDGDFYLIDWEYSSLNDPANDIAGLITRYDYDEDTVEFLLREYYGRELTDLEHRHFMGQSIVTAFYWISWPLLRDSMGEEDGFFILSSFRYIINNIDDVLESYRETELL